MLKLIKILALVPVSAKVRGTIYRCIFNHRANSKIGLNFKIGFGSYIDSKDINIGKDVSIGNMVRVKFLDSFQLGEKVSIGSSTIICGAFDINKAGNRSFSCGNFTEVLCSHYFDVVAPITIGNHVTIAGKWTQFYTHSFDLMHNRLDGSISIGNHVYIGSGCLINLGVDICDNVVLQGGTCVNKSISEEGVYMSNMFLKRGSVHEYSELYHENQMITLKDGTKVYMK